MISKDRSPFTPGVPVPVEYFVGRLPEIERLEQAIKQCTSGRNENRFLTGERGIGKSSLARFARVIAQREYSFIGAHCYLDAEQTLDGACAYILKRLLEELPDKSLLERAKKAFERYIKSVDLLGVNIEFSRDTHDLASLRSNFLPNLWRLLERIQPDKKGMVLILDDLNGISKVPEFAHFLKSLIDEMATSQRGPLPLLLMLVGVEERRTDLARAQPSLPRIFQVIELAPMSDEETQEFFIKAFCTVGYKVDEQATQMMVSRSGGLPMLMHEIGDATFWVDQDGQIDTQDALAGIDQAAENVGRKYLEPQVYQAIRSKAYLSILRRIGKMPFTLEIKRSELLKKLSKDEKTKLDNFLRKMCNLGVLQAGEGQGEYRFANQLYRLYISLEAQRAEQNL